MQMIWSVVLVVILSLAWYFICASLLSKYPVCVPAKDDKKDFSDLPKFLGITLSLFCVLMLILILFASWANWGRTVPLTSLFAGLLLATVAMSGNHLEFCNKGIKDSDFQHTLEHLFWWFLIFWGPALLFTSIAAWWNNRKTTAATTATK